MTVGEVTNMYGIHPGCVIVAEDEHGRHLLMRQVVRFTNLFLYEWCRPLPKASDDGKPSVIGESEEDL